MQTLFIYDPSVVAGFVLILWFAWRWFAVPGDARRSEYLLLIAIFAVLLDPAAQAIAESMSRLRPMKMDLYAYGLDGYMGEPAFVLGRMVAPHAWAKVVLNVAYGLPPTAVTLVLAWHILRRSARVGSMVWAFVLSLLLAPVFYLMVPVCGPKFAFPVFPADPGTVIPHMIAIKAAPNGMPSVHMSIALLVAWFSRRSRVASAMAGVYLALIVVATLASGQHYAVDLIAAVPYAAGVVWLSKLGSSRKVAASTERDRAVGENLFSGR